MAALFAKRAMRTDWETPEHIFEALDAEFRFTLDAAATTLNRKCRRWFADDDDGLTQDWGQDVVWLNPPYGDANLRRWIHKAHAAALTGATVVCLVPVNASSQWWNDYAPLASELRWGRGRVRFVGAAQAAPFASAFMIFRPPVVSLRATAARMRVAR